MAETGKVSTEMIEKLRQKSIQELQHCSNWDTETAHCDADEILCDLLRALGFDDVVKEYEQVEKWYA